MTSLGILRICFEKESAERAEGDNDNDNDNETARSAHQVTGEQTYPALCYHVPGTSVNAGEPPLVLYCSLASPLPTSPPMIQGETKWGTPPNSGGPGNCYSVGRDRATGTFRRSGSRNPLRRGNHGEGASFPGNSILMDQQGLMGVSCQVVVSTGPRRCPSRRRRGGFLSASLPTSTGTPRRCSIPWADDKPGGGGLMGPRNPCAAVGVDQISKGQRGMLSIGAPGRFFNVKPDTGGGKTGGGRVDPRAETVRAVVSGSSECQSAQWGEWLNRLCHY